MVKRSTKISQESIEAKRVEIQRGLQVLIAKHGSIDNLAQVAADAGLNGWSLSSLQRRLDPLAFEPVYNVDKFLKPLRTWLSAGTPPLITGSGGDPIVFNRQEVLERQEALQSGDVVTVISCGPFLEASDSNVFETVYKRLCAGVTYRYVYPLPDELPHYGSAAYDSFAKLQDRIAARPLPHNLKIAGIGISGKFRYFSMLHTLIHYETREPQALMYVRPRRRDGQTTEQWYQLPETDWGALTAELLDAAAIPFRDRPMRLCGKLTSVRVDYLSWFRTPSNAVLYAKLRGPVGHGDRCVAGIRDVTCQHQFAPSADGLRVLDVGCGDGEMTLAIAKNLANDLDVTVAVTGLDYSEAQLRLAADRFKAVELDFEPISSEFEKWESNGRSFDVILAIHSLYTVDLGHLTQLVRLLRPGGLACIWMGSLENNVVNQLSDRFDADIRFGQRRNYAEDVYNFLELVLLPPHARPSSRTVTAVVRGLVANGELTADGADAALFSALGATLSESVKSLAKKVLADLGTDGTHPVTDQLITFRRPLNLPGTG